MLLVVTTSNIRCFYETQLQLPNWLIFKKYCYISFLLILPQRFWPPNLFTHRNEIAIFFLVLFLVVLQISTTSICCCSVAKLCPTLCDPWTAARQAPWSPTISWSLLKFISIELVMLSNHLIICCSLLLLPSTFPSIGGFYNELAHLWDLIFHYSSSLWMTLQSHSLK